MRHRVQATGLGSDGLGCRGDPDYPSRRDKRCRRWIVDGQKPGPATRVIRVLAVAIGLLLSGALGLHQANAGTYVMRNCNVPGHGNSLMYPWQVNDSDYSDIFAVDRCASGEGFAAHVGDSRRLAYAHGVNIYLTKPTGARSEIDFVKLVVWYAARLAGTGNALYFRTSEYRTGGSLHVGLFDTAPGSESVTAEHLLSPETTAVHMSIQCGPWGPAQPDPCVAAHGVPWLLRGMEVTLSEDVPPIVLPLTGSLLAGGLQSGVRSVIVAASDAQSGLRYVEVMLGGTVVATHDLTPRCPHSDFTVCPASEDATLQVDTRVVANGSHQLSVRVRDAAGNEQVVHGASSVEVANPSPSGPRPATASNELTHTLSARFRGTSRSTLTVPYGRRVSVSGQLTNSDNRVAAGTEVEILEKRDARGAREMSRARLKTRADGSFSAALVTTRPSRRVRLAYRSAGSGLVVSETLRLRVRAASRVSASLRGRLLRFSGRVLSAPMPKVGKRVVMEGRSPGSAWTPFRRLRTDRQGRFSGTYRLRVRRPGVRLQVRLLVPSESGYGYVASRSRTVTLRVR